jgi:glycosyltransferase involved in cell wall biosynthesis
MNPVHVCHITSVHPAHDTRIFIKECASLAQAGFHVSLLVLGGTSERLRNVDIIGIPFQGGRLARIVRGQRLLMQAALQLKAQIFHFHDPELLPLGYRLKKAGAQVIYDAHEDLPRQIGHKHYIPFWCKKMVSGIVETLENYFASRMSAIVTVTPTIVRRFMSIHPLVVEICNYPDLADIQSVDQQSHGNKLCYIGGITEARGIKQLMDAIQGLPTTLILAGAFSPPALKSEMEQHPAWNQVDYRGFVDREGVNQILKEACIGLVTLQPNESYQVAYPVKMFEYMAAGLAVVATDIPLWKEILDQHEAGVVVDIFNRASYATNLNKLLDDKPGTFRMGQNGKKATLEIFNWKHEADKLIQLYQLLIPQKQ